MLNAYQTWKEGKAQHEVSIVLVRLHSHDYVTFDEDAALVARRCIGTDYVPQVLADPTEGCEAEFRFRMAHVEKVVAVLLRNEHRVFTRDVIRPEDLLCAPEVAR